MKPKIAVFKLTSCDGCQLQLLDAEDALLALAGEVDIVYFREATSRDDPGPYDVTLVEGSISKPSHLREILDIRERSRFLVTIGACATTGGIQALRNLADVDEFKHHVYPHPEYISTLSRSTPVSEHVKVDLELPGCPIDRGQLLGALSSLLRGTLPKLSKVPVCVECKRRGFACVVVTKGEPCLGPITATGCGALCPAFSRGCYGCFGPAEGVRRAAMRNMFASLGVGKSEGRRRLQLINPGAPAVRQMANGDFDDA